MKKFKAIASYTTYVQAYIEAETEDEAHQIALDMDGGSFTPMDEGHSWWQIADVIEVKE
jgi:hypothetical protein